MRGLAVLALLVSASAFVGCSSDGADEAGASSTTTAVTVSSSTTEATTSVATQPTTSGMAEFDSGATVTYPSDWISYGAGVNGIGFTIPDVADVAVRDAAATENLLGSIVTDQDTLEGAFDAIVFGMGLSGATIGETGITTIDGRDVLSAPVVFQGNDAFLAVVASGDSYGYIWLVATASSLPQEAADAGLQVLASLTP